MPITSPGPVAVRFGILPQKVKAAWEHHESNVRKTSRALPKADPNAIYISGERYTPPSTEAAAQHDTLAQKVAKLIAANKAMNDIKDTLYDARFRSGIAGYDRLDFKYDALDQMNQVRQTVLTVLTDCFPIEAGYALEQLDQLPEHVDPMLAQDLLYIRKLTQEQIDLND